MRSRIFVGSSREGLKIAQAIAEQLDQVAEPDLWNNRQVFPLGSLTLSALESRAGEYDFALIVMTPDDVRRSRDTTNIIPRDNLIFELGLFMGRIGPERTLIVRSDAPRMKLPSDLDGLVVAFYAETKVKRDLDKSIQSACEQIKERIQRLGISEAKRTSKLSEAVGTMSQLVEKTNEILSAFEKSQLRPRWFDSVHSARSVLLSLMQECVDAGEPIAFDWLGMTMYNVWNTLPGILAKLGQRNPTKVTMRVAMLSREWLTANRINTSWTADSAKHQLDDIERYFRQQQNDGRGNWTVEIRTYSHMPAVHGGLLNDRHLLLGICQWDRSNNLWAGDKPYELYTRSDLNRGSDRISIFKGWFQMCWDSAVDPSILQWKSKP